jgi:hypothetical protein
MKMSIQQEKKWLQEFIKSRRDRLKSLGKVYEETETRLNSALFVLEQNSLEWNETIQALNNDGDQIEITCNSSFTIPNQEKNQVKPKYVPFENESKKPACIVASCIFFYKLILGWL